VQAGSDKSKVASVTVYLANMIDFDGMNAVYDAWVDKANPPARLRRRRARRQRVQCRDCRDRRALTAEP
jgi:enamine deaminase RidA (YjgF/YER057c/UK114 family)